MRMRTLGLAAVLGLGVGCEEDNPTLVGNPDAVVLDSGRREPLPLETGMQITYNATFTRNETGSAEVQGSYRVTLEIVDVEDNGNEQPSTVTFTMRDDSTTMNPDWSRQIDADTWVGRLGPSVDANTVASAGVQMTLDGAPSIPPAPLTPPKELPPPSTYFIDIRDEALIATDWLAQQAGRSPTANPADDEEIGLTLESDGLDEAEIFTLDVKRRRVSLAYRTDGILEELTEVIGDPTSFPRTTTRLFRVEGP